MKYQSGKNIGNGIFDDGDGVGYDAYNDDDDDDDDDIGLVQDLTGGSDQGFAAHPKEGEREINFKSEGDDYLC